MKTKKCSKCDEVKPLTEFKIRADNGLHRGQCYECRALQRKQNYIKNIDKRKQWLKDNKEKIAKYAKDYQDKNKEKIAKNIKQDRKDNPEKYAKYYKTWYDNNKQKASAKSKKWYEEHKEHVIKQTIEYNKKRREENIEIRIRDSLRARIRLSLHGKSKNTIKLLGCSIEELKQHLQSQFTSGMSWDNYGLHGWHIDHIKPCSKFDLLKPSEQRKCFGFSNLQPLWAIDNIRKSNKLDYERKFKTK